MSLATSLADLRTAGAALADFHKDHIPDATAAERLFEFAVLMELVERLLNAPGWSGKVVRGRYRKFSARNGDPDNFDRIEIGPFILYFNIKFDCKSGATYSPDVALVHQQMPDRPFHVRECKHYPGRKLSEDTVRAFVLVVHDLNRPSFPDSTPSELVPGFCWVKRPKIHAPTDADALRKVLSDAVSSLWSTAANVSAPMRSVLAPAYGCEVVLVSWSPT